MNVHSDSRLSNVVETELSTEDELLVERLVDGELSEEEREKIVYRLDETIDGWRCCALAFLEAQSFREALKNPLPVSENSAFSDALYPKTEVKKHRSWKTWRDCSFSAAAGFMIAAVAIGGFAKLNDASSTTAPVVPTLVTNETRDSDVAISPRHIAEPIQTDLQTQTKSLADSVTPKTVVLNSPAVGLSNITTPCCEVDDYNSEILQMSKSVIPQEVMNHMYNVGGTIDAHRDEYRFPLDDNRVLIVPVDTYDVKSNRNQTIW